MEHILPFSSFSMILHDALLAYHAATPEERQFRERFLRLLQHPRAFQRDHLPGHITGSAWIVDEAKRHVLLTHHAKLNRWLQPGGHADGDENVRRVALREAEEETGLHDFTSIGERIFDIDIHTIPARHDFPEHEHYDVRFLLVASRHMPLVITAESHDLRWIPLTDLARYSNEPSILRMHAKLTQQQ